MRKAIIAITFVALMLAGCKSKQDQLTELTAQFDTLNAQYQKDCLLAPVEVIQRTQAACKEQGHGSSERHCRLKALNDFHNRPSPSKLTNPQGPTRRTP